MIRIYGASDDLVEIEGHPDGDEVGCYDEDVLIQIGDEETGGVVIRMSYAPRFNAFTAAFACWSAEIAQIDEDKPIPWPISISTNRYSVEVRIDAPPSVALIFRPVARTE